MRTIKRLITAALAVGMLAVPASALAKRGDRDHDGMPDKWEMSHHLNPHANDARKDPDHDGLSNLSEFRHHTNPQVADTDGDGMNDGQEVRGDTNPRHDDDQEVSGTIASFENGVLTIQPAGDGAAPVSGTVNDATRIECGDNENEANDDAPATQPTAAAASDGDSSGSGDGSSGSGTSGSGDGSSGSGSGDGSSGDGANQSGDDNSNTTTTTGGGADNAAGGDDDANENSCTSADLTQGAQVREAKFFTATDGSMVFTKIELVPAA